jgi:hypothetical protein
MPIFNSNPFHRSHHRLLRIGKTIGRRSLRQADLSSKRCPVRQFLAVILGVLTPFVASAKTKAAFLLPADRAFKRANSALTCFASDPELVRKERVPRRQERFYGAP